MNFDGSIVDEFICESKEHVTVMEKSLLTLEDQKQNPDKELVNEIFRAIHTIKGSAGFLGLTTINTLSHTMETLLSMIREGNLKPSASHIDALLEGVDQLNALLDDVKNSNDKDITEIYSRLNNLINNGLSDETNHGGEKTDFLANKTKHLSNFTISEYTFRSIPKEYRYLYILKYELCHFEKESGKSPVALVNQLLKMGYILDGFLEESSGTIDRDFSGEKLYYNLLYASVIEPDLIADAVELDNDSIKEVKREVFEKTFNTSNDTASMIENTITDQNIDTGNSNQTTDDTASHPHETIRMRVDILDKLMILAGELVLVRNQQLMHVNKKDPVSRNISQRLNIVTSDLQETIMRTRMQPIGTVFGKFKRIVRDLGKKLGKKIEIEMTGNDVELDKTILETLTDPLVHIIRNCCDHGIETPEKRQEKGKPETGTITLIAYHEGGQMNVEIRDDGKGIDREAVKRNAVVKNIRNPEELAQMSDKEILSLIFLPGMSTAEKANDISGRGVGMDVVKTSIEKLGGIIDIKSENAIGTTIRFRLPLTLAIIPSIIVSVDKQRYAIPRINLEELVCLYDDDIGKKIECVGNKEMYRLRDSLLPLVRLNEILKRPQPFTEEVQFKITEQYRGLYNKYSTDYKKSDAEQRACNWSVNFAVMKVGGTRYGLIIDRLIGTEEIVVKPMHQSVKDIPVYSGATILGDGSIALILDAIGIAHHAGIELDEQCSHKAEKKLQDIEGKNNGLLLFKSGKNEQFALETPCIKRIEKISLDTIERIGNKEFIIINGLSTQILRLNSFLDVSECMTHDTMYLIIPKGTPHPYGILMSQLIDIGDYAIRINKETYNAPGLKGSAIIKDKMTLFLDVNEIIKCAEPQWCNESS